MKTIIQQDLYDRGKRFFDKSTLELLNFDVSEEDKMVLVHKETNAKCFIIGAEKYSDNFFKSINPGTLVIRFGVGYDSVPIDICKKRDIKIAYTPRTLDESVAEHTIGLLLSSVRKIPRADRLFRENNWDLQQGLELKGKTIAIIGFGKIGQKTANIAKNGFDMKINAYDVYSELDDKFSRLVDFYSINFAEVVKNSDFVSLHLGLNKDTEGFINREKIKLMNKETILINTARGKLINEIGLFDALNNGDIAGAALDVFANEPYSPKHEEKDLRLLNNVILTPHISSNTDAANKRMTELSINNAINYYEGNYKDVIFIPEMS